MRMERHIFGIDLGTTYSCIAYVDEYGKAVVIPNQEHNLTTPSVILFEGESLVVGEEAKNSALISPESCVEMVKRHMGEANWRFSHEGTDYTPEEISSYILRKLTHDASVVLNMPVKEVVITCPAYFGIAQREATARAGELAGLHVREIINEPTAAAITYGLGHVGREPGQEEHEVVLVYDLGGGTFDVTVIAIHDGAITVIATGGDHHLGGRNWDETLVVYLAAQWQKQTGSRSDPLESPDTLQDLWLKAEKAKWALSAKPRTKVIVAHGGEQVKVDVTRETFDALTLPLVERTLLFTQLTIDEAKMRGAAAVSQMLLVGGSTKMPQITQRLRSTFGLPLRIFEPEESVAKGAALYGEKLRLEESVQSRIAELTELPPWEIDLRKVALGLTTLDEGVLETARADVALALGVGEQTVKTLTSTLVTNVTSHSFGILAMMDYHTKSEREVIENLMLVNDPLPTFRIQTFGTLEPNQPRVELRIMENNEKTSIVEPEAFSALAEIGKVILPLPAGLPANSPIEVTFELNQQGRLHVIGHEPRSNVTVRALFETRGGLHGEEFEAAKARVGNTPIL
jgi:molecular chaperone DnaK